MANINEVRDFEPTGNDALDDENNCFDIYYREMIEEKILRDVR